MGMIQRKILLLLLGGFILGLSGSPRRFKIIQAAITKEWKDINRTALRRAIQSLYESKLIRVNEKDDGTLTFVLSERGTQMAYVYHPDKMKIKRPVHWDGKWHIIAFDIPEKRKNARDALRLKLREIGLEELQKSMFICPFACEDEVNFLTELFQVRPHVRVILAESIDNELHLKKKFKLV